jgi:hypothetical protein
MQRVVDLEEVLIDKVEDAIINAVPGNKITELATRISALESTVASLSAPVISDTLEKQVEDLQTKVAPAAAPTA